jgi:hypothetical protein
MRSVIVLIIIVAVVLVLLAKIMPLLTSVIEELQWKTQVDHNFAVLCLGILIMFVLAVIALIGRFFGRQ